MIPTEVVLRGDRSVGRNAFKTPDEKKGCPLGRRPKLATSAATADLVSCAALAGDWHLENLVRLSERSSQDLRPVRRSD